MFLREKYLLVDLIHYEQAAVLLDCKLDKVSARRKLSVDDTHFEPHKYQLAVVESWSQLLFRQSANSPVVWYFAVADDDGVQYFAGVESDVNDDKLEFHRSMKTSSKVHFLCEPMEVAVVVAAAVAAAVMILVKKILALEIIAQKNIPSLACYCCC